MLPLGHCIDIIPAIIPLDLQTARVGDFVSLKNAKGCLVVVLKGIGTAGDDPVISLEQASDVAGTGVKALSVVTSFYKKIGATALTGVGAWTQVTQTASDALATDTASAEGDGLWAVNIEADQLDVDGGFDCIRVSVADVGNNAQLGCALYILHGLRYPDAPEALPNSIAD